MAQGLQNKNHIMIINDPTLPYHARVSGNEIILEFKPDGQTFNLNKLSKQDGIALAERLWDEAGFTSPLDGKTASELVSLRSEFTGATNFLNERNVPIHGANGIDALTLVQRLEILEQGTSPSPETPVSLENEPNDEKNHSSTVEEESPVE
jgi:hypothetical protein